MKIYQGSIQSPPKLKKDLRVLDWATGGYPRSLTVENMVFPI